jgi:uncharacterized cupin superfamily protein
MEKPMNPIVNIADVKLEDMGHGDKFSVRRGRVAPQLGLQSIGCSVQVIPAGKRAYPLHRHHVSDELFYVVSGTGEYRFGKESYPVRPGDLVSAPAGTEPHQLVNTGNEDLRCLAISNMGSVDVVDYPDSGKIGVGAGIKNADFRTATYAAMGRLTKADYWDGEDGNKK